MTTYVTSGIPADDDVTSGIPGGNVCKFRHTNLVTLWTCAGKPKSSEAIQNHLNQQLRYPCATRWNSLHDSVHLIVENKDKINDVMMALKLLQFKDIEIEFLEEYCLSLKPISNALDRLQSENGLFYGDLIPTLLMTNQKLS